MSLLAYLINQYPQPSHTFICREIAAIERGGSTVLRFTLRSSRGVLVDPADEVERTRTRSVLGAGPASLIWAALVALMSAPVTFFRAVGLTRMLSRASNRGKFAHLAYLFEACLLRKWLKEAGVTHLHAHFGTNSTAVAAICRALGGPPYSFTVHGPEEFDQPLGLSLAEKTRRAAFAITISSFGAIAALSLV